VVGCNLAVGARICCGLVGFRRRWWRTWLVGRSGSGREVGLMWTLLLSLWLVVDVDEVEG
jgi:hypothetical protein